MASRVFVVLCASILLVQNISAQCIGNRLAGEIGLGYDPRLANGLAYGAAPLGGYGTEYPGYGLNVIAPTSGRGFPVTSSSSISPTGIRVVSENAIEGPLSIIGELPFLSAIALEGSLPTGGAGLINYGCGNGAVGIVSEGIAPAYGPASAAVAPGRFGYGAGYGAPVAAPGMGAAGFGYNGLAGYGLY